MFTKRATKSGVLIVLVMTACLAAACGGSGTSSIKGTVSNVVQLDANEVRVYIVWANSGTSAASDSCAMDTTVHNQFGDEVNIRVNSTATNGDVQPGATQNLYQDIGVDNGDAQYVTAKDIQLVGC